MAAPIGALRAEMSAGHAQFERDMGKARDAVRRNGQSMETSMNRVSKSFTGTVKAIATVGAAYMTINKAWEYANLAAKYEQGRQSFKSMADAMGADAEKVFGRVRELSGGLIDDNALIESMNKAISLGIPIEKLGDLMLIARAKSRDMGITTTQAFNDIATGIGRGSPLILDNLGLVMKVGTANENMAKSLGKTANELTDKEKKMAILNATLEAGREALGRHNLEVLTDKERMDEFATSATNLSIELGKLVKGPVSDLSGGLASIVRSINETIEANRKWKEEQGSIETVIQNEIDLLGKKIAIHSKFPWKKSVVEEMALQREQLVLELESLAVLKKRKASADAEAAATKKRAKEDADAEAAAADARERARVAAEDLANAKKKIGDAAVLQMRREVELYGKSSELEKMRWETEQGRYADILPAHKQLLLQYAEEMDRLNALAEANKAAMEKVGESTDEAEDKFKELKYTIEGWGQDSAAAIADFAMSGETSFRDMIDAMIRDLLRMAAYQNITAPLFGGISSMVGKVFSGGATVAGGSTTLDLTRNLSVSGFHSGGIVGRDSSFTRSLPGSLFSHAPRLHSGLMPDEFPAILQKGEAVIPKDAVGGGGDTNVFIYAVDSKSFEDMCKRNPSAINTQVLQSLRDNKTRSEIKSLLR